MKNVGNTSLTKYIELKILPFQQYTQPPKPGILVMNPPYGERISVNDLFDLYSMIGERLKHVFTGYNAWIISNKDECFDKIGLRPKQRMKLMNGELECDYRCFELFDGKNKDYKIRKRETGGFEDRQQHTNHQPHGYRGKITYKKDNMPFNRNRNTIKKRYS
jgi:putative N6-adenine-specific DNA methylase